MEYTYKGYKVTIEQDNDMESPREWDNLGTMVCKHKRYDLGDTEAYKKIPWNNLNSWQEVQDYILNNFDVAIILPVFMYEHSGIQLNTTGFSCKFDSGQVGFIFIETAKLKKEMMVKKIGPKLIEKVTQNLRGEVNTYSRYLEGEVYWYSIKDKLDEEIDSCGGYYGYDETKKICEEIIDQLPHNNAEKFIDKTTDTLDLIRL